MKVYDTMTRSELRAHRNFLKWKIKRKGEGYGDIPLKDLQRMLQETEDALRERWGCG